MNEEASRIRKEWMQGMGIDEEEIAYYEKIDPPVSVEAEQEQLNALHRLKGMNLQDFDAQMMKAAEDWEKHIHQNEPLSQIKWKFKNGKLVQDG